MSLRNGKLQHYGFTLIELMVAMALGIFLVGGVVLMFSASKASSLDAEQLSRMQENIRFASDLMIRDIRNAGFRDDVSLLVPDFDDIGVDFAETTASGDSLTIKYGGRGTCVEEFDTPKQVLNRYFVLNNELRCEGLNPDGSSQGSQALVQGVRNVNFEIICPASNPTGCPCTLKNPANDLNDSTVNPDPCIGVRVLLTFDGPRSTDGASEPRDMLLSAAFRNVILEDVAFDAE